MSFRKLLAIFILIVNTFLFYVFTTVIAEAVIETISKFDAESYNSVYWGDAIGKFSAGIFFYLINIILTGFGLNLIFDKESTIFWIDKTRWGLYKVFKILIILFGLTVLFASILAIKIILGSPSEGYLYEFILPVAIGILLVYILNKLGKRTLKV